MPYEAQQALHHVVALGVATLVLRAAPLHVSTRAVCLVSFYGRAPHRAGQLGRAGECFEPDPASAGI